MLITFTMLILLIGKCKKKLTQIDSAPCKFPFEPVLLQHLRQVFNVITN